MKSRLATIAAVLAAGWFSAGPNFAGPNDDVSASFRAEATNQGQRTLIAVLGPNGLSCSAHARMPAQSARSGKSGSKTSSSGAGRSRDARGEPLRMRCSDGSTARVEAKRDSDRREWSISFHHQIYGRADLRAREN